MVACCTIVFMITACLLHAYSCVQESADEGPFDAMLVGMDLLEVSIQSGALLLGCFLLLALLLGCLVALLLGCFLLLALMLGGCLVAGCFAGCLVVAGSCCLLGCFLLGWCLLASCFAACCLLCCLLCYIVACVAVTRLALVTCSVPCGPGCPHSQCK